jgi:hypothetical protein
MQVQTVVLYKGEKSGASTESAVLSWSADAVQVEAEGDVIKFLNKDGSIGATIVLSNGAKLRKIG